MRTEAIRALRSIPGWIFPDRGALEPCWYGLPSAHNKYIPTTAASYIPIILKALGWTVGSQ
jgi:hypothetical protein